MLRRFISIVLLFCMTIQAQFALVAWAWYWMDGAKTATTRCISVKETLCNGKCYVRTIIVENEGKSSKASDAQRQLLLKNSTTEPFVLLAAIVTDPLGASCVALNFTQCCDEACSGFSRVALPPPKA